MVTLVLVVMTVLLVSTLQTLDPHLALIVPRTLIRPMMGLIRALTVPMERLVLRDQLLVRVALLPLPLPKLALQPLLLVMDVTLDSSNLVQDAYARIAQVLCCVVPMLCWHNSIYLNNVFAWYFSWIF
jgi:hypothetical protein